MQSCGKIDELQNFVKNYIVKFYAEDVLDNWKTKKKDIGAITNDKKNELESINEEAEDKLASIKISIIDAETQTHRFLTQDEIKTYYNKLNQAN